MHARTPSAVPDLDALLDDPIAAFDSSFTAMHAVDPAALEELQLAGVRRRFEQLRDRVGVLTRLADHQGVRAIDRLDDVSPLLFEHTVYKGYPASFLRDRRFDALTTWLGKLTTLDLGGVDTTGCRGIDDWIERLDRTSPLKICHSSGTGGTVSFVPWSKRDMGRLGKQLPLWFQRFGAPRPEPLVPDCDAIFPSFRHGSLMHFRIVDAFVDHILGGDESRLHTAFPSRMSADAMYLAARLRKSGRGAVAPSEEELELLRAVEAAQREAPAKLKAFLDDVTERFAGRRVFMMGVLTYLLPMAQSGLARGVRGVFHPESVVCTGGGGKGVEPPPNWRQMIAEFTGVPDVLLCYGTSEISTLQPMCRHGRYHTMPWTIPFVLDPDTGRPLPRTGTQTGRMAFFDLLPDTHWGGFVTGDEVTIHWPDAPCPCGQRSPSLEPTIARYADKGGDDKITCAATPEAHAEAMAYLREIG